MIERIERLSILQWGLIGGAGLLLAFVPSGLARVVRTNGLDFGGLFSFLRGFGLKPLLPRQRCSPLNYPA